MNSSDNNAKIIFVEDDDDQMELLILSALDEISELIANTNTTEAHRELLKNLKILKVSNLQALEKAVTEHKGIFLAVLDCNIPDKKGDAPNDQLVQVNHRITGQHRGVEVVTDNLPDASITLISSMYRFKKIVYQYYELNYDINITFIGKDDPEMIQRNIGYRLRQFLRKVG